MMAASMASGQPGLGKDVTKSNTWNSCLWAVPNMSGRGTEMAATMVSARSSLSILGIMSPQKGPRHGGRGQELEREETRVKWMHPAARLLSRGIGGIRPASRPHYPKGHPCRMRWIRCWCLTGRDHAYKRRFLRMCSHSLVDPVTCNPASGWEKGQVENQVGLVRERFFSPRLRVKNYDELNDWLPSRRAEAGLRSCHPCQLPVGPQPRTGGSCVGVGTSLIRPTVDEKLLSIW
jgi:hypothetical protein